jgi:hypothetical protein
LRDQALVHFRRLADSENLVAVLQEVALEIPLPARIHHFAVQAGLARGCAWSFAGFESEIDACAAPVFDARGQAVAAVSVAGPSAQVREQAAFQRRIEETVRRMTATLSGWLGYVPPA